MSIIDQIDEALDTKLTNFFSYTGGHGAPEVLLLVDHETERAFYLGLRSKGQVALAYSSYGKRRPYRGARILVTRDVEGFEVMLNWKPE